MMRLHGKTREQIAESLAGHTRDELIGVIFSLATVEQHFKPAEVAERTGMDKRTVLKDIHAGLFGGEYLKRAENQILVSSSGVNKWLQSFRVRT